MTNRRTNYSMAARWFLAILACTILWSTLQAQEAPPPIPTPDSERTPAYPVVRVIDARTVTVLADNEERGILLCGVRAPNTKAGRDRLQNFLENLLCAEAVFLQYDPPSVQASQGPRPAYLFRAPDGLFVNLEVIRQAYAKVQAQPAFEYVDVLRCYERRAKLAKKGVWAPRSKPRQPIKSVAGTTQPAPDPDKIIVYVTKSGKKYHRKDCYHLRKSSRAISLREAVKKGYGPCSHCKPPTLENP